MHDVFRNAPHRRYNPLLDEWVLVSPHRTKRPWQGQVEDAPAENLPAYDPGCYLCPGNRRSSGEVNPDYTHTFAFDNDFAALLPEPAEPAEMQDAGGLIRAAVQRGVCRVICFSPRHDLTLARMSAAEIARVIDLWADETQALSQRDFIRHIMIFENKGAMMGCSNPHPHGQIWASQHLPSLAGRKVDTQLAWRRSHGSAMLLDYLAWEIGEKERIISSNEHFVSLVPFWAVWPFEAMIVSRREVAFVPDLDPSEREAWASILKDLEVRYDALFRTSFPYSMGVNQRPADDAEYPGVVLHQSFYPPLLRSATVKKFQVGYEMSGEPQRDITPEQAAARLRECAGLEGGA